MKSCISILFTVLILAFMIGCTGDASLSGAGGQTTNGFTVCVIDPEGIPGVGLQVRLRPQDYFSNQPANAVMGSIIDGTTDNLGRFTVDSLDSGSYIIEVNDGKGSAVAIACTTSVIPQMTDLGTAKLSGCCRVVGRIPAEEISGHLWFVKVYGMERNVLIDPLSGEFVFSDLPGGRFTLRYEAEGTTLPIQEVSGIVTKPGETIVIPTYPTWRDSLRITLNTSVSGADVAGNVYGFPLLVRLTKGNFDFARALGNGADVRFTKADGTPLQYEIERWDSVDGIAEVWVKVDTVYGNNATQHFMMHYGNQAAASKSNPSAVFDTTQGFQGVWHLADAGSDIARDATGNSFSGVAHNLSAAGVPGTIGTAQEFNGETGFISIANTADSKLNFPEHGTYSVSAWVYSHVTDSAFHVVVSKGDFDYTLQQYYSNDWEFTEFLNTAGWDARRAPVVKDSWTFLQAVRTGTAEYLYVNGDLVDSGAVINANSSLRNTSFDVMIGRIPDYPDSSGRFFDGIIDEVRISSTACSPDWIKLCYRSQMPGSRLVELKNPQ
jgi:hypothetical protein